MGFKVFVKNKLIIGGAFICCMVMVAFPEVTASASKEAISLWLNAVVPTLFPFLIMANFLRYTGVVSRIPPKIYPFAMAMLSGYPMGARITADYYRGGCIDEDQLRAILSYSMITGPAFIVSVVGVEFFGSQSLGYILAVSHYLSAGLNGMLYSRKGTAKRLSVPKSPLGDSYYSYLTDSILDSFRTIAIILAYIIMFMIATDLLQFSGLLALLPADYLAALSKGVLEMTVGCSSMNACQCDMQTKLILTSFIISFGGFSILGQSMSMLKRCPVTLGQLFRMKLSHGIISAILTFTIFRFVV